MRWAFQTTWITGASSGIGAAIARALAAPDRRLLLSGRSVTRLEETASACRIAGAAVELLPFDLADASARQDAARRAADHGVDAIVNNAGQSQRARAEDTDPALVRELMEIDFLSQVELTLAVLPGMIERGKGAVIAVSSVAGLAPVPLRSAYNAAKAAQIAWFGTLGNEVGRRGVTVTIGIPGFVRTEVSRNARTGDGAARGRLDPNQRGGIDPADAARAILEGAAVGRRRVYSGLNTRLRLMLLLARFAPRRLDALLSRAEVV